MSNQLDIEVRRLCFNYSRNIEALKDVDLNVEEGEFVTIVGPSGCGKSTLLFLISGLYKPTKGEIYIKSKLVNGVHNDVGFIFQEYNRVLLPWRTVMKNITLGLELKGIDKKEAEKIGRKVLELVGLKGFENFLPAQLSGGMKQRVQIARILALNPPILLMDEPFGALDAQTKENLQDEFSRIWEKHRKTVLFVTHDVEEAVYLGDYVAVMSHRPGTIVDIVEVDIPRPRTWDVKSEPRFVELRRQVASKIRGVARVG
ncbi:MAG: ABC transporter ATP-binding protein [Candidatus Caldarchaeum sp.]|nr:ABC transporter ATP-binding protein [Candidatus Caldarchaeum sp.]